MWRLILNATINYDIWLYTGFIFKLPLLMNSPRKPGLRWKCHGKSRRCVRSLFHEHLPNDCAVCPLCPGIQAYIALKFSLWESSGREILWLRCSELTVGLDDISSLAGASQTPSVCCCCCGSPVYLRAVPDACWEWQTLTWLWFEPFGHC